MEQVAAEQGAQAPGEAPAEPDRGGQSEGPAGDELGDLYAVPVRPRWLRVGELRISYVDVGSGPVVLLIHGLAHSIHGWRKNIGPLARAGYRVMAIDLPGFGWSDKPGDYSLDLYVAVLRDWLRLHCIDEAALVGNSMGGLISAAYSAAVPEQVWATVLVDPAGFAREQRWLFRLARMAPTRWVVPHRATERMVRRALRYVYFDRTLIEDDEVSRAVELASQPGYRDALVAILRGTTTLRGMRPAMGLGRLPEQVTTPTLVIWGDHDRLVPVSHARKVQELIPGSELTILENAGHSPQMEVPDAFNERVLRFLGDHRPAEPAATGG